MIDKVTASNKLFFYAEKGKDKYRMYGAQMACDMIASIPMTGDIDSLNASVAAGVLAYEIVRQRLNAK